MNETLLLALIAGFLFAEWPLVMRYSQLSGPWVIIMVAAGTIVVGFIAHIFTPNLPASKCLFYGCLAGIVNGLGMVAFGRLISNKATDLSIAIPLMVVFMAVFGALSAIFFYGEPLTIKKGTGLAIAAVAAFLLS